MLKKTPTKEFWAPVLAGEIHLVTLLLGEISEFSTFFHQKSTQNVSPPAHVAQKLQCLRPPLWTPRTKCLAKKSVAVFSRQHMLAVTYLIYLHHQIYQTNLKKKRIFTTPKKLKMDETSIRHAENTHRCRPSTSWISQNQKIS